MLKSAEQVSKYYLMQFYLSTSIFSIEEFYAYWMKQVISKVLNNPLSKTYREKCGNDDTIIGRVSSSSTPWDLSCQIWQLQAQIWHLLTNLHRPPPHHILPFSPPTDLSNPYFFSLFHFLWPRMRCPLHCLTHCYMCLSCSEHSHGHAPQRNQRLWHC